MTQTRFDQAARRVARLDAVSFFGWLLTGFAKYLRFRRWLDTRTTPTVEEESEQTGDTVAELESVGEPAAPWLFPQEFQTEPDADMYGRLLRQGGQLWLDHRPDPLPGSRYQLAMGLVNLTGTRQSAPASSVYHLPGEDDVDSVLKVRERWLAEEPAAELLDRVERGELGRVLMAFIPLMYGGGDSGIIQRWLTIAGQEPDPRLRGEICGLALVLADLKDWYPAWQEALEGWNMRESRAVLKWKREAEVEALQRMLRGVLEKRFGAFSNEVRERIEAISDPDKLYEMGRQAVDVARPEDLPL